LKRGITPSVKLEEVIYGHLNELNGKYKMRATEMTFAAGAYLGLHHHVGPGIRSVLAGELAFTEGGQTTIFKAGDCFFETGNLAHTVQNRTAEPLNIFRDPSKGLGWPDDYCAQVVMSANGASRPSRTHAGMSVSKGAIALALGRVCRKVWLLALQAASDECQLPDSR
jgi:quercetin dioxygenase-like cupin family protein